MVFSTQSSNTIIPLTIAGVCFAVILTCTIVLLVIIHLTDKKILSSSKKIKALGILNSETQFYSVKNQFCIEKFYDNKFNFAKINPSYLMLAHIKDHIDKFAIIIDKIKKNKEQFAEYTQKATSIPSQITQEECDQLKISLKFYQKREDFLFRKRLLLPILDCYFTVNMHYSSPKGKVQLDKHGSFNFDDMRSCFESISRSNLDYDTRRKLALAERGEVSDSLRYDVLKRDNFRCVICGASAETGARLHVDHIIPVSKGGKSEISNLRTLCERCNVGKSDKIESPETAENLPINTEIEQKAKKYNDSFDTEIISLSQKAQKTVTGKKPKETLYCPVCHGRLVKKTGKYGKFYGCSNYPKCNYTRNI